MKAKRIATVALVMFVCAVVAYLVQGAVRSNSVSGASEDQPGQATGVDSTGAVAGDRVVSPARTAHTGPARPEADRAAGATAGELSAAAASPPQRTTADSRQSGASQSADPDGSESVTPGATGADPDSSQDPRTAPAQRVLAYYFHGTQRCPTCRKLEAYSAEAIRTGFVEDLKRGNLEWRVVNVDEPQNKHFVDDYKLYTKSLVIVKTQGGKQVEWKNLEKIWELVGEKEDFVRHVQDEVAAYLGGGR